MGDLAGSLTGSTFASFGIRRNCAVYNGSRSRIRKRTPRRKPSSQSVRFLAICFIHVPVGLSLIPAISTLRVSMSITKKAK